MLIYPSPLCDFACHSTLQAPGFLTAGLITCKHGEHLGACAYPHFFVKGVTVAIDGMNREDHFCRNLLERFPGHDALENLQLLPRQFCG